VLGIMMVCYVAVPARLIGVKTTRSRRDKVTAAAVGGALGAVVCAPPYLLGRVGILMLGSPTLFILGIILLCVGGVLEAGAEGAVKAVKVSAKLVTGHPSDDEEVPEAASDAQPEVSPLAPIFTKRIDPQSEVRPAGSEDAVDPPGTDDLALPRWYSSGTAIPILDDFTLKRLGMSTWPRSRPDRAPAMSSKRRMSSQRYIPDCSATRTGRRSANRLYNEARQ
jgi:hypothetical protein